MNDDIFTYTVEGITANSSVTVHIPRGKIGLIEEYSNGVMVYLNFLDLAKNTELLQAKTKFIDGEDAKKFLDWYKYYA